MSDQDNNQSYPVGEEFYYSMSRDLTDKDTIKFHWWEAILYGLLLGIAFFLEIYYLNTNRFFQ